MSSCDVTLVNAVFPTPITVPPHGILYLTSSLRAAGRTVELRDYQLSSTSRPSDVASFAAFADADSPILGISCMSYALPLVIEAARILKSRNPDRALVLGGIGPSAVATRLLAFSPDIDAIVIGEGEVTFVELCEHLLRHEDLSGVAGIAYRDADGPRLTPARPRVRSLGDLPRPAYADVDFSQYRLANMQYGRGCPFRCTFCDIAPYWGRKHTRRPVADFVDELEMLVGDRGVRDVFFVDDTFVLSRAHVEEICGEIIRRGIDVGWGCYARADLVSEDLLETMASAGCRKIFYGIESGSDAVLAQVDKGTTRERMEWAVHASLRHIPFVTTSFVWGFPEETFADLEETVCLLLYFAAMGACPQLNLVLPYSYSSLFRAYRSRLTFDPRYSSQLLFYQGERAAQVSELIRRDVELFSAFYQLPTVDFLRKWEFLASVGLHPHELQSAFFEPTHQ
jgi:anaerobic magnesium-protoporphyrin IX monomethyl ester cyclase